jgi:hypothetical protein
MFMYLPDFLKYPVVLFEITSNVYIISKISTDVLKTLLFFFFSFFFLPLGRLQISRKVWRGGSAAAARLQRGNSTALVR